MRLFQGNPNIVEVYMQANSLQTLYAAQFPIDQLEKLYLGDNPLQCNCTLFWLWRLVTGNFDNGSQGNNMKPGNMMSHEAGSVAALGTDMDGETDDNLVRVAAYVAERKKDVSSKYRYTNPTSSATTSGFLKLDAERIGCEIWHDSRRTRKHLAAMTESEITCPAHVVTIVCAILTCLLVVMTGASIIFYMRFVKRRRKLMHDRSLRSGKSIVNVHDRILPHQPLSAQTNGGIPGTLMNGSYPHHTLQTQRSTLPHHNMHPLHHQDYHQTMPQVDKLELERYLTAQAIANEYRALKPWELPPVKDSNTYTDEPEHLYEKFDHYEYPDTHTMTKTTNGKLMMGSTNSSSGAGNVGGGGNGGGGGTLNKPHIVYV